MLVSWCLKSVAAITGNYADTAFILIEFENKEIGGELLCEYLK